jgi:hypothetical protein
MIITKGIGIELFSTLYHQIEKWNTKMPTLNWIGKEAVVNHHQQVPLSFAQRPARIRLR